MKPIRVLQFITPSGFYGAERWVIALANNLDPAEVICELAVTDEGGSQDLSVTEYFPGAPGSVHRISMAGRFDFRGIRRLLEIIRVRRIDVIHTHGYKSDILGFLAARRAGIRCVSTPHGFSGKVGLKLATFIRLGIFTLRYFDAVVPLSEELVRDMSRFGIPDRKVRLIANGVDLREIEPVRQRFGPGSRNRSGRTLGFIGQLIPRKGVRDLLDVFERLYHRHPDLRLEILGDGPQRAELEAYAATLDSQAAIAFPGFCMDRLQRLAGFDLFVMTSSLEGIPRCLMEAMAMGVPVAAYDIPGVDQLIEHETTGLLASHGDIDGLTACCERLLSEPELAARLAAAGRQRVLTGFSAEAMAQAYTILFRELVSETGPHRCDPGEVR